MEQKIKDIQDELNHAKDELERIKKEKTFLEKAIWEMLNYSTIFVLLLDKDMNIKLINWNLANRLGFENEKEPLGKCWLEFIRPNDQDLCKKIHKDLTLEPEKAKVYKEVLSDIITLNNDLFTVKWFNIPINNNFHLVFSFGVERSVPSKITEESLRSYYTDIIEKDKTMIISLKDAFLKNEELPSMCKEI